MFEPLKILVVDDEPAIREVLGIVLGGDGHHVEFAEDGSAGLSKFMRGEWDVVITDKTMPRMNGEELARAIKEHHSDIPVILLSGFAELREQSPRIGSPFDLVVRKPFTRETLTAAINCVRQAACA